MPQPDAIQDAFSPENMETLPAAWYHDADIFAREVERIFGREWMLFGHEGQLEQPGAYIAATVAGKPVFVLRGKDGELRAFHNVCRHRAGPLFADGCGAAGVIRCKYHGWVYGEDGCLKKTPGFGEAADFDRADFPLFRVSVASWRGLVFVNLSNDPPPLERSLGDLPVEAEGHDIEGYKFHSTVTHRLGCNWKTYVENYMEGYHIPVVHPGLNREVEIDGYRVRVADRMAVHETPTKEGALNAGFWPWIWPNAALNVYSGGMNVEIMNPVGPEDMEIRYIYMFTDLSEDGEAERQKILEMSREVTQEDIDICAAVQRNLRSGVYDTGRLSSRHENGVGYFQSLVREALA